LYLKKGNSHEIFKTIFSLIFLPLYSKSKLNKYIIKNEIFIHVKNAYFKKVIQFFFSTFLALET